LFFEPLLKARQHTPNESTPGRVNARAIQTGSREFGRENPLWDKAGRLKTLQQVTSSTTTAWTLDAANVMTIALDYDADGMQKATSRTQGSGGSLSTPLLTTFTRFAAGSVNEGRLSGIGHSGLHPTTNSNCQITFDYDAYGRVTQESEQLEALTP
jgi:hypothetical protein